MTDAIFARFLQEQLEAGLAMAAASDLLELTPLGSFPPRDYLVELRCTGLVCEAGVVKECNRFLIGIHFGEDHLRRKEGRCVVTILDPNTVWHPNVRGPAICIGFMPGGVGLVDLVLQTAQIISLRKHNMRDPLNQEACRWLRNNLDRLPIDPRPLLRPTHKPRQSSVTPGGKR